MKVAQRPRTGDAAWQCEFCKKKYVIPDLARQCEDRHLDEAAEKKPDATIPDLLWEKW